MSAVLLACKFGHAAIVDLLLRSGCDGTTFGGGLWRTGPVFTCQYGHVEVLKVLIEHGCFHDAGTQVHNEIPLHVACTYGHDDCIELILERRETFMAVAKSDDDDNGNDENDAAAAARGDLSNLHDSIPLLMRIGPKGSERAALQCYLQSKHDQVSTSIVLKMLENDLPCTAHGAFCDHGHSWWHLLERQSGLGEARCAELVKALLDCELRPLDEQGNPTQAFTGRSIVRALASTKDPLRRLCLQHTWPLVKRVVEKETYFCGRYDLSAGPPLHISDSAVVVSAVDHDPEVFYEEAFSANLPEGDDMLRTQEQFLSALRWLHDLGLYAGFATNETEGHNEGAEDHWKKAAGLLSTVQHRRRSSVGFNNGAKSALPGVSRKAFLGYCLEHVGETAHVAFKFMHYREQWLDEMRYRGLEPPASSSSPLPSSSSSSAELDRRFVVGLLPHGLSEDAIFSAVEGTSYTSGYEHARDTKTKQLVRRDQKLPLGGSAGFPYAIIMPLAERSLAQIFREENPSPEYARQILIDLASALQHCHERGVMHGDVKMSNVVRVGRDIKLIDLDSALFFPIPGSGTSSSSSSRSEHAGLKFSSANLPPEMFYELASEEEHNQFVDYWAVRGYPTTDQSSNERAPTRIEDKDKLSHWKKLRPTLTTDRGQERTFVVRTYSRLGPNGEEDSDVGEGLPYRLLPAGPSLDLWALGMLAYHLLLGKALLASNVDEDLITISRMQEHLRAATWSSSDGPNSISRILRSKPLDADAIRFLCTLLNPDADERGRLSMQQVLDSAFLSRAPGAGPDRHQVEWLEAQLAYDDRCAALKSQLQSRVESLPKDANLISLEGIACREEVRLRAFFPLLHYVLV
jgi:serine/threonine protein kinase